MLNVGPGEVLVILVIALVVLGPSRLPATARTMGRVLAKTRDLVTKFQQEMQAAADAPLEALARERGRVEDRPAAAQVPAPTAGTETGGATEVTTPAAGTEPERATPPTPSTAGTEPDEPA